VRGLERGWGEGGEMTQTLYAHMNKIKIKKKINPVPAGTLECQGL
jgi:hypothetical protein